MSDFDFGESVNRADMDNPFNMLRKDLDDIDIPSDVDNSLMMTSDFFDSVFPLGPGCFDEDLNMNRTIDLDSDVGISSDADDMRLTNSCSPDSAGSSTGFELNDFILVNDNQIGETVNLVTGEITRNKSPTPIPQKPKIFINKPNARKVIVTKPYITKPVKKFTPSPKQVIRVQSIPGSKKSLLLPFNVTKMKNIKIVNGNSMKAEDVTFTNINDTVVSQKSYLDSYDLTTSPDTFDEDSDSIDARSSDHEHQYPMLSLTDEEKRLLSKEGICLPTHYPLTKQEERELKRIRRKIRNKISAQDSRKRKKEYVDGLEESVRQGVEERKILMSRINQLQKLNNRIMVQMGKLQALVCNTSATKATPTASLLIVLLSVLLVTLPNLRTPQDTEWKDQQQVAARRALLSCKAHCEEVQNLEEFLTFNNEDESELQNMLYEDEKISSFAKFGHGNVEQNLKGLAKHFVDNKNNVQGLLNLELDDDIRNTFIKVKKFCSEELDFLKVDEKVPVKRKFIEPDIDEYIDYGPSSKILKISDTGENYNGNTAFDVVSATVSVNSSEKE